MPCTKLAVTRNATSIQTPSITRSTAGGGEGQRKAQVVPVRQQVAADHFAGAQRQHFIGEEADVDGLHRAPQAEPRDGAEQRGPAPPVHHVDGEIGDHRERDPAPVQRAQRGTQFVDRVAVQHPEQAAGRNAVAEQLRQPPGNLPAPRLFGLSSRLHDSLRTLLRPSAGTSQTCAEAPPLGIL